MYEERFFAVGTCLGFCAIVAFLPLVPSIAGLFFQYSRAAHFTIISDVRFILTIALGIVGSLFVVYPSLGSD